MTERVKEIICKENERKRMTERVKERVKEKMCKENERENV